MTQQSGSNPGLGSFERQLAHWRHGAAADHRMLVAIRGAFVENCKRLDEIHPDWLESGRRKPNNPLRQDTRRAYFEIIQVVLRNRQFSDLLLRNQLTDPQWWVEEGGGFDPEHLTESVIGWLTGMQLSTFHNLLSITEATLRAIVRAEPKLGIRAEADYGMLVPALLKRISLFGEYEWLFDLLAKIRNTIHNNGIYFPRGPGKAATITYQERTFTFEKGNQPSVMDEGAVYLVADWLNQAMYDIVTSPDIAAIPYCPRV